MRALEAFLHERWQDALAGLQWALAFNDESPPSQRQEARKPALRAETRPAPVH